MLGRSGKFLRKSAPRFRLKNGQSCPLTWRRTTSTIFTEQRRENEIRIRGRGLLGRAAQSTRGTQREGETRLGPASARPHRDQRDGSRGSLEHHGQPRGSYQEQGMRSHPAITGE